MTLKEEVMGGGFAEVRDGETITPTIRPKGLERPARES